MSPLVLLVGLASIILCGVHSSNINLVLSQLNSPELSPQERQESLNQLDQDSTLEGLKATAQLLFFGNEFIVPDYEKSLEKYEKAYELNQGDSEILFMLGLMHSYGVGCELDDPKGLMFMVASARLGYGEAHAALSHVFYNGLGVEKNCPSSRIYLISAARKCLREMSVKDALTSRKPVRLTIKTADSEKAKSQQEALDYYEYSAKGGDGSANMILAQLYYFGTDGKEPDYEKARIFFEKSLSFGHDAAYGFLGQMYYRGEGVPIDYGKALKYFSKAAERGVSSAYNGLGLMYWHGHGVEKDLDTAEAYFKQAADLKYPEAFYNYAMVLLDQPSAFNTDKIFQNLLAATKSGFVFANVEIVKRYLKSETSCPTSIAFLRQIMDKGQSLKMFRDAHYFYTNGKEDQALSRYIYLAALGHEVANFNAGFILEKTHLKRAAFFYSRSAKMDNSEARKKVGDAFYKLGDPVSAVAHYVLASKLANPDPEALFNLGYAYETGIGLRKDLWSALDMYTASLARGKSGKIAVSLAITSVRFKLFLNALKNIHSLKLRPILKTKSKRESDKLLTMIGSLIITSLIYLYVNYFHPRQQRRVQEARDREGPNRESNEPSIPETQTSNSSVHSDSSSESDFTAFQFRRTTENQESVNSESDEVD